MPLPRVIGLVGGVTWLSTLDYYREINEEVARRLGGVHSARLALVSLDFHEVRVLAERDDEPALLDLYADAAARLERAGAEVLLLCTNTAHRRAEALQAKVGIPLLHIADATGRAARSAGFATVGLLGTRATMVEPFVRGRLEERFGLKVLAPPPGDQERLERAIFAEMARGQFLRDTAAWTVGLVGGLAARGADAVILGCTELPVLLRDAELPCPRLDTVQLHARAAVDYSLEGVA